IVNDPRGLREANEKLYIFNFPSLIPPTIVTRSPTELRRFLDEQGGQMIVKPLDRCGGGGGVHVRGGGRKNKRILEAGGGWSSKLVRAQAYLPAAGTGDKRILLLEGNPIGAVLRVPRPDETRGNLHAGGIATRAELTDQDRQLCAALAPRLRADGLYFVGI